MLAKTLLTIILLSVISWQSWAEDNYCLRLKRDYSITQSLRAPVGEEFEGIRGALPSMIRQAQLPKLAWVDFNALADEIERVRFCINTSNRLMIGSGARAGAVYFAEERIVVINGYSDVHFATDDTRFLEIIYLLLHEVLGALGYPDENYEVSSYLMAEFQRSTFGTETTSLLGQGLRIFLQSNPRRLENVVTRSRSGGITGVGGGGDPQVILFKPFMVGLLVTNPEVFAHTCGGPEQFPELVSFILQARIDTTEVGYPLRQHTEFPGLFLVRPSTSERSIIVVQHGLWPLLRQLEDAGEQLRSQFMQNLLMLSCRLHRQSL